MSILTFAGIAVAVIVAVSLKSITGFGTSLILMPIFAQFFEIRDAIVITALIDLTTNVILIYRDSKHFTLSKLKEIGAGLLAGTAIGVFLLNILDTGILKITLGALILFYILLTKLKPKLSIKTDRAKKMFGYIFGFVGGIFGGLFNTNGPAIFVYVRSVFPKKETVRANLVFLFLIDSIWRVSLYLMNGQYSTENLITFGLVVLPALLFGLYIGTSIDKKLKNQDYSNVSKIVLAISGIKLLFS